MSSRRSLTFKREVLNQVHPVCFLAMPSTSSGSLPTSSHVSVRLKGCYLSLCLLPVAALSTKGKWTNTSTALRGAIINKFNTGSMPQLNDLPQGMPHSSPGPLTAMTGLGTKSSSSQFCPTYSPICLPLLVGCLFVTLYLSIQFGEMLHNAQ